MTYVDVPQRGEGWHQERLGSLGASEVYQATAKQKNGKYYATREDLLYKKLAERVGVQSKNFVSDAMRHGIETESTARSAYEIEKCALVKEVGIYKHNRIKSHASPDGIVVGTNIGIECKCQQPSNHIKTLMTGEIPEEYIYQMQWQMAVCGFEAVDYVAFHPLFPKSAQLFIQRVYRDPAMIEQLENEVEQFLKELDEMEKTFRHKYTTEQ